MNVRSCDKIRYLLQTQVFVCSQVKEEIGVELTDSLAMLPAASVSAVCFASKNSSYFAVGKIDKDQVDEYAARKKMDVATVEKWLGPILKYQ